MTRTLNAVFAAAAIFASATTSTIALAAESAPQPTRAPVQVAQAVGTLTNSTSAPAEPVEHFHGTHPGGR